MKMKLAEIAKAINAQNEIEQWKDIEVTSVSFDSRHLEKGALFPSKGRMTVTNTLKPPLPMVRPPLYGLVITN